MKRIISACAVWAIAITALAGDGALMNYRWVVGPASIVEKVSSPDTLECTANNGWALCEQTAGGNIGRIHIIYTISAYNTTKVFTRYTDNRGRSWSEPRCLSRNSSLDSSYDAAIACLGCTLAAAFSDIWSDRDRHMMYAQDTGFSGEGWSTYDNKPLSDPDHRQYGNRHPSVAVTWRPYSVGPHSGPLARPVWVDSARPEYPNLITAWPFFLSVRMKDLGKCWWEHEMSDSWGEYPSVCWNGVKDNVDDAFVAYEGALPNQSDHEIFVLRSITDANKGQQLTNNNHYDGRPCIQVLDTIPEEDGQRMDTLITVYESKPFSHTRIYLARWHLDAEGNLVMDTIIEAFPNWRTTGDIGRPNIWRRHYPPNNTNDTVFMVLAAEYPNGLAQFWSISTDEGRSWKTPERVIGPVSPNASIIGGYRYANILASLHSITSSPRKHYLVFFPLDYIDQGVPPNDVAVFSSGRLLQQNTQCSPNMWCVINTGEYPVVLSSTDNGLSWENYGSPGWGGTAALSIDSDTLPVAAFLDSNVLYCSQPIIDRTVWTPVRVYEAVAGEVLGPPSVALYPGDVAGMKVAGVAFAVYDTVEGTSRIMFAKVDTGTVILDTIDMQE